MFRASHALPFLCLSLSIAACDCEDDRPPARDGGVDAQFDASTGPCTEGELLCFGQTVQRCESGERVDVMECMGEMVCAPGIGCSTCVPRQTFCQDNGIYTCNEEGTGSELVQQCPAAQVCVSGSCQDACAEARAERSNIGCDYMLVDLDNEFANAFGIGGTPPAQEQFAAVLANPSDAQVSVFVFQSNGTPNAEAETMVSSHTIAPNDLLRIDLPAREVDGSTTSVEGPGTFLSNRAYRIETDFPVVAYQFNPIIESASNDASLLLPIPALGSHYRVLGWPTANPIEVDFPGLPDMPGIPDHSYVTIVGTQPGTVVTVTLGGPIVEGRSEDGSVTIPATPAGGTVEVTLGRYDVLNLESDGAPGDLSGTLVQSTAPVSVFSGGERGIAPINTAGVSAHPSGEPEDWCCTEHLEEQVFPTEAWGKDFVITRSPVRSSHPTWREPDLYRIIADKNGTVVETNLPAPNNRITLNANQWREFSTDQSFVIRSNEAVSIQQILVSQDWVVDWKSGHGGDPSMILYPPAEQYRDNYIFLCPDTFSSNYAVISRPVGSSITLDGASAEGGNCAVEPAGEIDGVSFETVTCLVDGGTHRLESDEPVGLMVYGYHNVGSYGYAGGSNLTQINPLI